MNRVIRDVDRNGRGYSFPALRAKVIYGQEFRKKGKLASKSRHAKRAFDADRMSFMVPFDLFDEPKPVTVTFGADMHRVATYLEERAKQHDQPSPPEEQ